MKKIFVFICCLGISLQGFHTYSSQKKEEEEQHYQSLNEQTHGSAPTTH